MTIKYHPKNSKEALYLLRRLCKEQGIRIFWNRPLAKGMYHQLKERVGHLMLSGDIYKAIGHHVNSHSYLISMKEGAQRFDINGKVSGVVTAEEAQLAHKQRGKKHRKLLNRGKKKGPGRRSTPQSLSSTPRRNSPAPTVVIRKKRKLSYDNQ
ncbi:ProQ/FINO family protein [Oceanimonas pelagia]|uniref:ProQ/FINO family protein n=1 Tax=Oceanimonas pelagia TaxID=3028314 RepID=A0AA50KK14_9GAMM|nr:ProQ/FINO family protein [Oceanimonas pelagia]WMC09571.1 ProQ/FINO family protein [Oceanimonas pelagia]